MHSRMQLILKSKHLCLTGIASQGEESKKIKERKKWKKKPKRTFKLSATTAQLEAFSGIKMKLYDV